MKLTTAKLRQIIKEELNEIEIGGEEIQPQYDERPDQYDIVNDLVETMAQAGKRWAQDFGKNQTPEMAAKFEMFADKLEDALIQAAKSLYKS